MCGIIFSLNKRLASYGSGTVDFMKDGLIASQIRGMHSTGLFQVGRLGDMRYYKKACNASEFLADPEARKYLEESGKMMLNVGHVRHATAGKIVTANAHPFVHRRADESFLIGVHNGTLRDWKRKPHAAEFDVDSAWAMRMLAEEGIDAFENFDGAFAFVWYDSKYPKSLFIAKNKERPLFYMIDRNGETMVGCSELGMLGWIASRSHLKCAEKGKKHDQPYYIEDGKVYEFSLDNIGDFEDRDFPKYDWRTSVASSYSEYPRNVDDNWDELSGWNDVLNDETEEEVFQRSLHQDLYSYRRGGEQSTTGSWDYTRQENILTSVKAALRVFRYKRDEVAGQLALGDAVANEEEMDDGVEPVVVDHDALERAMHSVIAQNSFAGDPTIQKAYDMIEAGDIFLTTVISESATRGEIRGAKDVGMYGLVVNFEGIEFDDSTGLEIGTFEVRDTDGSIVEFNGEIRFLTRVIAHDVYHNKKSLAVVVGCKLDESGRVDYVVCARPTPEQRRFVLSQVEKFSKEPVLN